MLGSLVRDDSPTSCTQLCPRFPLQAMAKQKSSPQPSPYLDTLNLGKVMLFLMNKVNFSASDRRAGLKNKWWHVSMARRKGLGICQVVLHSAPWRLEMENSSWVENDCSEGGWDTHGEPSREGESHQEQTRPRGTQPPGDTRQHRKPQGLHQPGLSWQQPAESGLALPYTDCFWSQPGAKRGDSISAYLGTW